MYCRLYTITHAFITDYNAFITDCYSVYDHNGDGSLSREELLALLRPHVVTLSHGEERNEVAKDLLGEGRGHRTR